jgi:hypothetical protein
MTERISNLLFGSYNDEMIRNMSQAIETCVLVSSINWRKFNLHLPSKVSLFLLWGMHPVVRTIKVVSIPSSATTSRDTQGAIHW